MVFIGLMCICSLFDSSSEPKSLSEPNERVVAESNVSRVQGELVRATKFGISIMPTEDWAYLKVLDPKSSNMVFVNETTGLIATIQLVQFKRWPPDFKAVNLSRSRRTIVDLDDSPDPIQFLTSVLNRGKQKLESVDYQNVSVDWFQNESLPQGVRRRMGRIDTGAQELLVRVISHRRDSGDPGDSETSDAIKKLCDRIKILD